MTGTSSVGAPTTQFLVDDNPINTKSSSTQSQGTIPPPQSDTGDVSFVLTLPVLPSPKHGGLSLEMLIEALGMEERSTATKTGLETLKAKAQERDDANAQRLEEIQKRLEDMRSKSVLDGFLKAFKIIGMVLGAIASVATIALGAVTGNPVLVAAGVIMGVMAINSIVSEATDGKVSISAGVAALAKACGASEEVAQWIGMGVEIAISLAACILSFGAGFAGAGANALSTGTQVATTASKVTQICAMTQKISTIASGINTVAQGVTQGANAYYDYKITLSNVDQKELEAILERLQQAIDVERDFMEAIMERFNQLLGDVKELVQNNTDALTVVLTGSAPSMA